VNLNSAVAAKFAPAIKPVIELAEPKHRRRRWIDHARYTSRCFNCATVIPRGGSFLFFADRARGERNACELCGQEAEGQEVLL
jgi:hypothetical protein